jgi:2-polyprenyl-3-methyl-5-hydroxy-6-metoxy-1,4-benzoquinol methylase
MKTAFRKCSICDHDRVEVLHFQRFFLPAGHPLSDGYDVVCCERCGFVYADTNVSQSAYDRFYAEYSKYEDSKTGTGGIENPFDWQRQQETGAQIANFLRNPQIRILDVGCANGGLLKALQDLGYQNLCGIDPSPACVENTQRLGIEAHIGSLFKPFNERAFDCVILSHTLEHVQDLQGALGWIEKRLRPNGIVYIEVPDANRYHDFLYAPLQDFNTEHINHFSLMSLENLMARYSFTYVAGGPKILKAGPLISYPAIYGFWTKQGGARATLRKDETLCDSIRQYIQRSKALLKDIDLRLSRILMNSQEVIVWGTGQLTMKLLIETSLARANIVAFVDNNPINHGKFLRGAPIMAPNQLDGMNAPIVIATLLHHDSILEQIRQMKLANEIIVLTEK